MSHQITASIDTAQVVLYTFWIFFFGLIVWLRREDRREGYPLETDVPRRVALRTDIRIPAPKTFTLPHGEGTSIAPDFVRDEREIKAERVGKAAGYPLEPVGDPLLSGVGPASYAERSNHPELNHEDGKATIVPMRAAAGFTVSGGPDPRGFTVKGADGAVAGMVTDIWVDRADLLVRYLEMELSAELAAATGDADEVVVAKVDVERAVVEKVDEDGEVEERAVVEKVDVEVAKVSADGAGATRARLIPIQMLSVDERRRSIHVEALRSDQFAMVPTTTHPEQVTLREEERVGAFYSGGWFYAEPKRREPLV